MLSIIAKWSENANDIDPLLTDWPQMYRGGNYDPLLRIKQAAESDGILAFQQGVGSAFRPGGAESLDLSPLNRTQTLEEVAR
jgi:hypothetical protein